MAGITLFKVEKYKKEYYRILSGVYNDFRYKAFSDYNFELEPLEYDKFIKSVEDGLLQCLVLFEDEIPTGFLVYTTLISESLELNIIHCIGNENLNSKRKLLLEEFLKINEKTIEKKVVTYPMLGKQATFEEDIKSFGFEIVNTSVMGFNLSDIKALTKEKDVEVPILGQDYTITNWRTTYFKEAAHILSEAFSESSDALFDNRFTTYNGCKDIIEKITSNIYGEFLSGVTKILLYKKHPVGFCFANLTNEKIANIPLVAISKKHRGKGYSKILLKLTVDNLLSSAISGNWNLKELNASCDYDNIPAVKMYKAVGFTEQYSYAQAFLRKFK